MPNKTNSNENIKDEVLSNKQENEITPNQEKTSSEHFEELTNNIDNKSDHIEPTSSRKDVEVDKIFQLLKDAKDELKNKSNQKKERKERIDQIINDIPKSTIIKLAEEKKTREDEKNGIEEEEKKSDSSISFDENIDNIVEDNNKRCPKSLTIILLLVIFALTFILYDNLLNNNSILKLNKSLMSFNALPSNIQKRYVTKEEVEKTQNQLSELIHKSKLLIKENEKLENKIHTLKIQNIKEIDESLTSSNNNDLIKKIKSLKDERSINQNKINSLIENQSINKEKIAKLRKQILRLENKKVITIETETHIKKISNNKVLLTNEIFPAIVSTSKNYKILKCYDLGISEFYLSPKCKRDIAKFAKENRKAKRFEIIGVVDVLDFTSVYKNNPKTKNAQTLKKFNSMGLARYRVLETSWFLNEQLDNIVLTPVNYTITSKKNNRGSIIRAYY